MPCHDHKNVTCHVGAIMSDPEFRVFLSLFLCFFKVVFESVVV